MDEDVLQSLRRSGNRASQTYYRALARLRSSSDHQLASLHMNKSHNSRNLASPKRRAGTAAHCRGKPVVDQLKLARTRSCSASRGKAQSPKCISRIDATMSNIQQHMQWISLECESYFDSCSKKSLDEADRKHCQAFHRGVLKSEKPKKKKSKKKKMKKISSDSDDGSTSSAFSSSGCTPKNVTRNSNSPSFMHQFMITPKVVKSTAGEGIVTSDNFKNVSTQQQESQTPSPITIMYTDKPGLSQSSEEEEEEEESEEDEKVQVKKVQEKDEDTEEEEKEVRRSIFGADFLAKPRSQASAAANSTRGMFDKQYSSRNQSKYTESMFDASFSTSRRPQLQNGATANYMGDVSDAELAPKLQPPCSPIVNSNWGATGHEFLTKPQPKASTAVNFSRGTFDTEFSTKAPPRTSSRVSFAGTTLFDGATSTKSHLRDSPTKNSKYEVKSHFLKDLLEKEEEKNLKPKKPAEMSTSLESEEYVSSLIDRHLQAPKQTSFKQRSTSSTRAWNKSYNSPVKTVRAHLAEEQKSRCGLGNQVKELTSTRAAEKQASSTSVIRGRSVPRHTRDGKTDKDQGIHIVTRPGRYIVRRPEVEPDSSHLVYVKPGSFMKINLT